MPEEPAVDTLVIGCGNLLRGDDAAGPTVLRLLGERDLRSGVRLVDAGTSGMDVTYLMRGMRRVILVDASSLGVPAGTVHRVPASELEGLAAPRGNLHDFTWQEALGFARWLLEDDYPREVSVYLVEGAGFDVGAPLSPEVSAAVERIADAIVADLSAPDPRRRTRDGDLA